MNERNWQPDVLGSPFENIIVDGGRDYSGRVQCVVIRLLAHDVDKAVVYVHGFSDYFFQRQMAEKFAAHGDRKSVV